MKIEEAITMMTRFQDEEPDITDKAFEALDMAIKALEMQKTIKAVKEMDGSAFCEKCPIYEKCFAEDGFVEPCMTAHLFMIDTGDTN